MVALIGLATPVALGFPVKRPVSTLDQCSYLPHCRNKDFLTSAIFAPKLAVMSLKWSAKYETPKSSLVLVLLKLPRRTGCKAKTLELHMGHA
jgi:hypothetical protein